MLLLCWILLLTFYRFYYVPYWSSFWFIWTQGMHRNNLKGASRKRGIQFEQGRCGANMVSAINTWHMLQFHWGHYQRTWLAEKNSLCNWRFGGKLYIFQIYFSIKPPVALRFIYKHIRRFEWGRYGAKTVHCPA